MFKTKRNESQYKNINQYNYVRHYKTLNPSMIIFPEQTF